MPVCGPFIIIRTFQRAVGVQTMLGWMGGKVGEVGVHSHFLNGYFGSVSSTKYPSTVKFIEPGQST
eukprot:scaffold1775_cov83-Cylindrotheca_fusiformis.AAC.3